MTLSETIVLELTSESEGSHVCLPSAEEHASLPARSELSMQMGRWIRICLRVLAVAMGYGTLVHLGNIARWREKPFSQTPLSRQAADFFYLVLDTVEALGLWKRTVWGIVCLLVAISSQFVLYTVFIDQCTLTETHREAIYGLLGIEAIFLLILLRCLWWDGGAPSSSR